MKKIFYLFSGIATVVFSSSCKKDYTCRCTTTYSYNGITSTDAEVNEITIKDASKHAAKANCLSTEQTYSYAYYGTTYTYTYNRDCELK